MPSQNLPCSLLYPFSEELFLCACLSPCFSFLQLGHWPPRFIYICSSGSPSISLNITPRSLLCLPYPTLEPSLSKEGLEHLWYQWYCFIIVFPHSCMSDKQLLHQTFKHNQTRVSPVQPKHLFQGYHQNTTRAPALELSSEIRDPLCLISLVNFWFKMINEAHAIAFLCYPKSPELI